MPMATGNPPARPRPTTARAATVRATRAGARAKARPGRASPMERDRARARAPTPPTFTAREIVMARARVTDRALVEPTATPAAERETATSRNDRRQPNTIESPGNGALSLRSLHVPRRYLLALRRDAARDRGLRARTAREAGDPRLHPRDDRRAPARRGGGPRRGRDLVRRAPRPRAGGRRSPSAGRVVDARVVLGRARDAGSASPLGLRERCARPRPAPGRQDARRGRRPRAAAGRLCRLARSR